MQTIDDLMNSKFTEETPIPETDNFDLTKYQYNFSNVEINAIKDKFTDLNEKEFSILMNYANIYELNPLLREIYIEGEIPRTTFAGINKLAHKREDFKGLKSGTKTILETKIINGRPVDETEIVAWAELYKKNLDFPISIEIRLNEFKKDTKFWEEMPHFMLTKVAKTHAIREAFGLFLYTEDEING